MSTIIVNDKVMQTTHTTVALVLNELGLNQEPCITAVNGKVISPKDLNHTMIKDNMVIDVSHPTAHPTGSTS